MVLHQWDSVWMWHFHIKIQQQIRYHVQGILSVWLKFSPSENDFGLYDNIMGMGESWLTNNVFREKELHRRT